VPHKQPDIWEQMIEAFRLIGIPLWAYFVALGGAIVHNARKLKDGVKFSFKELMADTVISLSIGYVTYFLCVSQGISFEVTVVAISLSSGMGNKYYDKVEDSFGFFLNRMFKR